MTQNSNGASTLMSTGKQAADNGGPAENDTFYQISDDDLLDESIDLDDDCLLEESDARNSGANSGRGPYERAWTTDATRALIHIRGPMEGRFTEGRQKRTALWLHCTRQLQKLGYRYSAAKVQKKWHNILITYNKNLSKKYQAGYVHWEFFEEMFKYLQGKKADFGIRQQIQHTQPPQQPPLGISTQPTQRQREPSPPLQQQRPLRLKPEITGEEANMGEFMSTDHEDLLQPQLQIDTKSNDEFDEDSTTMSDIKQPKLEYHAEHSSDYPLDVPHPNGMAINGTSSHDVPEQSEWWKDYFERKLETEREKLQLQRDMHREYMQFNKMSLVQQEKIERIKIDAINNLTATLQKLVEAKNRKT